MANSYLYLVNNAIQSYDGAAYVNTSTILVSNSIIPTANGTFDLGNTTSYWGTVYANSIQANSLSYGNTITTNTLNANVVNVTNRGITKNSMPTGSILQVVQTVKTDTFTTSSTTPIDITGMSATITPTSATSKIMVTVNLKWTINGHGDIYLIRNGSKIYFGDLYGNQTQSTLHAYGSSSYGSDYDLAAGGVEYLDSPATTSAVTYKLQGAVPYSSGYIIAINYSRPNENNSYNSRLASTITLYEIAQ